MVTSLPKGRRWGSSKAEESLSPSQKSGVCTSPLLPYCFWLSLVSRKQSKTFSFLWGQYVCISYFSHSEAEHWKETTYRRICFDSWFKESIHHDEEDSMVGPPPVHGAWGYLLAFLLTWKQRESTSQKQGGTIKHKLPPPNYLLLPNRPHFLKVSIAS